VDDGSVLDLGLELLEVERSRRVIVELAQEVGVDGRGRGRDRAALRAAAAAAIAANPKAVADFKKGKDAAKMAIVGAVMRENKGAPNDVVRRLVDEELAKV